MTEIKKYKAVKRFGARYGRKLKERFGKVEMEQRKKQKCPYCSAVKVKRIAVGIWKCKECGSKFTGKAYSVTRKIKFEEDQAHEEESPGEEQKEEVVQDG